MAAPPPQDALIELLARVGGRNGAAVLVSAEELSEWPAAAVAAMKSKKLLEELHHNFPRTVYDDGAGSLRAIVKGFSIKIA